ncbi:MAG TPA: hypothetical protein VMB05_17295 [Solirubrobacteraceae bacterium]|nr:hypothetical protein [Solirubrobacteraceae bacterium]
MLIAVAILGYVVGHASVGKGPSERQPAKNTNAALGYPTGWRVARTAPGVPALTIANLTVIAPHGNANRVGLMSGSLAAGELAPLPARFVAVLAKLPAPEIVNLVETQAYKYAGLDVPGYGKQLTIFVVPNPDGAPMVLACYAPLGARAQMRTCEESAASVAVVGEPQAYDLAPEPAYADAISTVISKLDRQRASLKRELRPNVTAQDAQQLATQLAEGFAVATRALNRIQPSAVAEPVQAALTDAVERSRTGYLELGRAIGERDPTSYQAAQKRIARAEDRVDAALKSFVLLGYGTAPQINP